MSTGGEVSVMPGQYFEYVSLNGRSDIVIRGCGPQTRIISPALQSGGAGTATPVATISGLTAVVEILRSQHVQLLDLCIEAADGECGVLLDRARIEDDILIKGMPTNCRDVRLAELAISASTRPGIYVNEAELVEIDDSRIAMKPVFSQFPGVYLSGVELRFRHNWVGLRAEAAEWLPAEMNADLASQAAANTSVLAANDTGAAFEMKGLGAPGGVQIGGASKDVFIIENEIEGGDGNGVALGSVRFFDANGGDAGVATGVVWSGEDNCATNVGNQIPPTVGKYQGRRRRRGSSTSPSRAIASAAWASAASGRSASLIWSRRSRRSASRT